MEELGLHKYNIQENYSLTSVKLQYLAKKRKIQALHSQSKKDDSFF
jgi:hypothetical protein